MGTHRRGWIARMTNPYFILLLFIVFICFQLIFELVLMPKFQQIVGNSRILDFELVKSGKIANEILLSYGAEGRTFYHYIQLVDMFYPIAYSLFLASLICYMLKEAALRYKYLCFIPLAGALFDYAENLGIFLMLRIFPDPVQSIADFTHVMSIVKFGFIALTILILIFLGFRAVVLFFIHLSKSGERS